MSVLLHGAVIVLGLYIAAEAIAKLDSMQRTRVCELARFVLAGLSGMWLVFVGVTGEARGITLVMAFTVALFIWPLTVARFDRAINRLQALWPD